MKIVCDSCGAKYSIADEKVAGRVFKIRCKKCGAAIVVRGDQSQEGAGDEAAAVDQGADAVWHVVVEGEQQGPFSPAQLGGMISANTIGWDAYVWREGFEDWKPAQDIEELVQAIMNPGASVESTSMSMSMEQQAPEDPFAEPAAPAAVAPSSPPSADAGADLFAQTDAASPFGGGGNPFGGSAEEEDVVASAPGPRVSASQAMTGARNENSVLFSLSNLQALATGGAPSGSSSAASASAGQSKPPLGGGRPGMAAGEGSGLIDIRALASATGLGGGGAAPSVNPGAPASPARVDDLLSIGTAAPGLGSALGAPVIIPEKRESSGKGLIIAGSMIGVGLIAAAGVFAVVLSGRQPDPATTIATMPASAGVLAPGAAAAPTAAPTEAPVPPPEAAAAPTGTASAGTGTAAPAAETGTAVAAARPEEGERGGSSSRARRDRAAGGGGSGAASSAAPAAASSGGSSAGSSSRGGGGGGGDIDSLLEGALGGGGRRGGGAASSGGGGGGGEALPEQPARADVQRALSSVQTAVSACGNGQHGTAMVAITVSGSNGRVSAANVTGEFAGTPVGSCVARAVRGATFPRFSRASIVINYPFRI